MRMFNVVEIASLIEGHAYGDLGVRVGVFGLCWVANRVGLQ